MSTPEEKPTTPDELDGLEKIHRRMKDEQEAWRKLLESLAKIKQKHPENPETENPSK